MEFTHFDHEGRAHMVSVSEKQDTERTAVAECIIFMKPDTLSMIQNNQHKKGDVLGVAQVAGIMGAKETSRIIPMCHPLLLTSVSIDFQMLQEDSGVRIQATVKTTGKTGVEMEALSAASITALTIYDMCKAVDKDMVISGIKLLEKIGGKSGHYVRGE